MGSKLKRLLKTLLKFVVAAAALYFVFRKIDVSQVLTLYKEANFFLLFLALIAFALSKMVSAFRLNMFFKVIDLKLKEKVNIQLYVLGMMYNLFLPGGIGGDAYKLYLLQNRYQTGTKKLLGAVLADRVIGMVALIVLALSGISLLNFPTLNTQHSTFNIQHYTRLAFLIVPFVFLAYYVFIKYVYPYFLKLSLATFGYSILVQLLQIICAWLLLMALGEQEHHLSYLVIFLVSSVVTILPISVGGIGVRELTFLYGSKFMNVDMNVAVGISFLFYLITAVVSLCGIYFVFRPIKLEPR